MPERLSTTAASRTFLGPALVYAATNIASSGIPLLLLPILTRVLSPEDYGAVTVFSVAVAVLAALTGLSVHGAVAIRYFERDRVDLPRYVGACLTILVATTSIVLVVGAIAVPWVGGRFGIPAGWLLAAAAVSSSQFVIQIRLTLWQSAGRAWQYGFLKIFQAAVDAGISLLLVLALGMAWQGRVTGIILATLIAAGIAMAALIGEKSVKLAGSAVYIPNALRFGAPLVVHTLGGLLITTGDKLIVGSMLPLDQLGQYAVAAQVAAILNVLYDALFKAFQPWVIKHAMVAEERVRVVRTIYKLLIGTTLVGATFYVLATLAYPILVGDRYRLGQLLLLPLVVAGMIRCGYFATAIFINIAGKNEHLAANSMLSGAAGLGSAFLLVPHLGVQGAAIGVVVAEVCSLSLNLRSSVSVYPMPWRLR